MSGSGLGGASAAGGDPSMDDILASIRRILSEDETAAPEPEPVAAAPVAAAPPPPSDVFDLDESMLVEEPPAAVAEDSSDTAVLGSFMSASAKPSFAEPDPFDFDTPMPEPAVQPFTPPPPPPAQEFALPPVRDDFISLAPAHQAPSPSLVAPEAAAAAAASMNHLLRSMTAERQTSVYRGGPTLEDMVRDEMRPMLKAWLDTYLPEMVERIVRSEIERVAGRVDL